MHQKYWATEFHRQSLENLHRMSTPLITACFNETCCERREAVKYNVGFDMPQLEQITEVFTLKTVVVKVFWTTSMDVIAECRYCFGYWKWRRWLPSANRGLWPNTFSLTTYYVNCPLVLTVCNVWQFRHYLCFFRFSSYLLYLFFSCLLPKTWWIKLPRVNRTFLSSFYMLSNAQFKFQHLLRRRQSAQFELRR